jgi:hypothetical protein
MSSNKAALKAIGAAIQASKYDEAVFQAQKLLANDPQNYQGYVYKSMISASQIASFLSAVDPKSPIA